MAIITVTKENFDSIKASEKTVLLDFYADWCGPCRMVSPLVDEIAQENPQYLVCKVNVDNAPDLAQAFGIVSIPTLVVLKNGAIANQAVGARSKEQILELLK
jgi:thioredoxin 1